MLNNIFVVCCLFLVGYLSSFPLEFDWAISMAPNAKYIIFKSRFIFISNGSLCMSLIYILFVLWSAKQNNLQDDSIWKHDRMNQRSDQYTNQEYITIWITLTRIGSESIKSMARWKVVCTSFGTHIQHTQQRIQTLFFFLNFDMYICQFHQ